MGAKGYNAVDFLMIRRLFQTLLKIFPECLVKLSYSGKWADFLILLLRRPEAGERQAWPG